MQKCNPFCDFFLCLAIILLCKAPFPGLFPVGWFACSVRILRDHKHQSIKGKSFAFSLARKMHLLMGTFMKRNVQSTYINRFQSPVIGLWNFGQVHTISLTTGSQYHPELTDKNLSYGVVLLQTFLPGRDHHFKASKTCKYAVPALFICTYISCRYVDIDINGQIFVTASEYCEPPYKV